MLLRHRPTPGSLSLPRGNALCRPLLPSRRAVAAHPGGTSISGRRFLVIRPQLAPWRRKTAPAPFGPLGPLAHRSLATALSDSIHHDDIPFVDPLQARYGQSSSPQSQPLYHLRAFDPATTLQIKIVNDVLPRSRLTSHGVPGGVEELVCMFDACLEVNKLERAGTVLERLAHVGGMPAGDLIIFHNEFLRACIDQALEEPELPFTKTLHHWFEVQIRAESLHHTPETIACMLKLSLLTAQGVRLKSLVARYFNMLPEGNISSVLEAGVLTQQDFGTITKIYKPTSDLVMTELDSIMTSNQIGEDELYETSPLPESDNTTPDVLSVQQKGLGLKTLRGVLSFFNDIEGKDLSQLSVEERREVQSRLEQDCVDAAIERWRQENQSLADIGINSAINGRSFNSQLFQWHSGLEEHLKEEFAMFDVSETRPKKNAEDLERCLHAPFMRQSTPARLAAITIMGVLNNLAHHGADKGVPLSTLLTNLAKSVEDDVKFHLQRERVAKRKAEYKLEQRLQKAKRKMDAMLTNGRPPQFSNTSQSKDGPESDNIPPSSGTSQTGNTSRPSNEVASIEQSHEPAPAEQSNGPASAEQVDELASVEQDNKSTEAEQVDELASVDPKSHIFEAPVYDTTSWPTMIKAKVGARLLSALIETAQVEVFREHPKTGQLMSEMQPALARTTVPRRGKKLGMIIPNKALMEMMKREPTGDNLARHLPMLVEPEPWTQFDRGGFIEFPSQIVRVKNGERDQRVYTSVAMARGDLDQVRKGLDVLGKTAWRINNSVFDVMLEAWNIGDEIANIPPLDPLIPLPEEPADSDDPMVRRDYLKRVKLVENEKSGLHSERCFMNFQLEIAKSFKDQTFYFPHNMDFRGRAYPIPAYLNHMGADHVRGLLRFAKGRELGTTGLRWLKVQLANVFGYDKASLDEREAFATDHMQDICDSVANPLTGQRWWLKAEDPWQCLAACFELKAALDSPDPTKFVSHLPVHQDGTCNGLQHYAALGGDRWGAEQVNLMPGERPADVYSAVANLVKEDIAKDLETTGHFLAQAATGKITRKVVKQTVMTNVYGVTFIGAKAQVQKQINAAYPNLESETQMPSSILASYIAGKIFRALGTMFRGAHDIQYWLGECAGRVCRSLTREQLERIANEAPKEPKSKITGKVPKLRPKSATGVIMEELKAQFRSSIIWTTPLRMPIVQPYRKTNSRVITTCIQDLTLQIPERSDPVNRRKQLQAFPPNFIHSLDASHMLLSALECDELDLTFAAVHDSFWTHAADVDVMNRVLRDAFIRIHSEDVIGRLASEFQARYDGSLYLAKVARGTDLEREIANLRSLKRQNLKEELIEEMERQKLLTSPDPEEVQKGREMVTPASLHEKMSSSETLPSNEELDEVALGSITQSGVEEPDDYDSVGPRQRMINDADEPEKIKGLMNVTHFEAIFKNMTMVNTAEAKPKVEYISFWRPLTFPAIPAKGDFDVQELKDSTYFFS